MKILAIDTSGNVATAAIYEDGIITAEYSIHHKKLGRGNKNGEKTHSETLLPMIDEMVKGKGLDINELDAIAVSEGPGSFTGLRIGSATAKGMGLALGKPIVNVPTLMALAMNVYDEDAIISPIMDARRQQVYNALYEYVKADGESLELKELREADALAVSDLLDLLNEMGRKVVFLGDGVDVYKDVIKENIKVPYSFAPAQIRYQRAGSVALLGAKLVEEGKAVNASEHSPVYLRPSQAERERAEALGEA